MRISEILHEAETTLDVEKDDINSTTLVDKTTGVKTTIDKKNPKSPKLAQNPSGQFTLQTPTPGSTAPTTMQTGTKVKLQQTP